MKKEAGTHKKWDVAITTVVTVGLLIAFVVMVYSYFFRFTQEEQQRMTQANLVTISEKVDAFLERSRLSLEAVAEDTERVMETGTPEELADAIRRYDSFYSERPDFTAVYAVIDGRYLDGGDWKPDETYVPTERPWYSRALEHGSGSVIVPPYVDSETGKLTLTVSMLLSDGKSVVALDTELSEVSDYMEDLEVGSGKKYIFDENGMIVSSMEPKEIGKDLSGLDKKTGPSEVFRTAQTTQEPFEAKLGDTSYTVLAKITKDGWTVTALLNGSDPVLPQKDFLAVGVMLIILLCGGLAFFIIRNGELRRSSENAMNEARAVAEEKEVFARRLRQDYAIINSLAGNYDFIFLVNAVNNTIRNYRVRGPFARHFLADQSEVRPKQMDAALKRLIPPEEFDEFCVNVNRERAMEKLDREEDVFIRCHILDSGKPVAYRLTFTVDPTRPSEVIFGFLREEE